MTMSDAKTWFTVTQFIDPQPEEWIRYFYDFEQAIERASHASECFRDMIFSVRDQHGSVLLIAINGQRFVPFQGKET